MPKEKDESEQVELPKWYLQLKKVSGQLFAGCVTAEVLILFGAKYLLPTTAIQIMHMIIIPFGIICTILSGFKSLTTFNEFWDTYKKIKKDG